MNKNWGIFLFFVLFGNIFVFAMESNLSLNSDPLNNSEVIESNSFNLTGNETVKVFISFNNPSSKMLKSSNSFSLQTQEIKENFNVLHDFGDFVSVELNSTQILELQENYLVSSIELPTERQLLLSDSVPLVNATSVWTEQIDGVNLTGKGETVCIIDSGVDFTHQDLIGKNLTCLNCLSGSCIYDCSSVNLYSHGTHVAGIIAANGLVKGVAPEANLISLRVFDSSGQGGSDAYILPAIDWCISHKDEYNISVISMSLGGYINYTSYCDNSPSEHYIANITNVAVSKNISVVVATGNDGNFTAISSPACVKNSTRVSSIDKTGEISSFANRAKSFLSIIFAPGRSITSTVPGNNYASYSGTSMATPHVSGAILILNQYKKLEGEKSLTPSQITLILNNSGKHLYDSSSNSTYSILDVYSAILDSDTTKPVVDILSPENNSVLYIGNTEFSFNVSDLNLKNVTFYLGNSSGVVNQTSFNISSSQNIFSFNLTYSTYLGNYFWYVATEDFNNNSVSSGIYNFSVEGIWSGLLSPADNSYSNKSSLNFSCESFSLENASLLNVTFYLWNSSNDLLFYETKNLSGNYSLSTFNYSEFLENNYSWACLTYDNVSSFSFGDSNYSLFFDFTLPEITLNGPSSGSSYTGTQNLIFNYSVNETNLANCSLIINGNTRLTNSSVNGSGSNLFAFSLGEGSYTWKVRCVDLASNSIDSLERTFSISSSSSSSSGGGGGGSSKNLNYTVSESALISGVSNSLKINQSVNFSVDSNEHLLVLNSFSDQEAYVTIFSSPIYIRLLLEEVSKVDLDNDGYYDLILIYKKYYSSSKISIYTRLIHEKIVQSPILNDSLSTNLTEELNEGLKIEDNSSLSFHRIENKFTVNFMIKLFVIIILVLVLVIILIKFIKWLIFLSNPENRYISNYEVPPKNK